MQVKQNSPNIVILLCSHQGEKFLVDQLESIWRQTHKNWTLIVSDDSSTDATLEILERYQKKWGEDRIKLTTGPMKGFCANFRYIARLAANSGAYFAFCDQDDIWHDTKLSVALRHLIDNDESVPALYCSSTLLVDNDDKPLGPSKAILRKTSFSNSLIENIAGGNTMVFNRKLLDIFNSIPVKFEFVSHDWALYQLVTAFEGKLVYDAKPQVNYRQHSENAVGGKTKILRRLKRGIMFLRGYFRTWMDINLKWLQYIRQDIPSQNQRIFDELTEARRLGFLSRVATVNSLVVFRQSKFESLIFKFGFVFGLV